jgi:hypothetical protein
MPEIDLEGATNNAAGTVLYEVIARHDSSLFFSIMSY